MQRSPEIFVIEQGYIRTIVSARTVNLGYGVAIEVFGRLPDNCWKEVLRFDCFEREPHWHRFPATGGGIEEPLPASSVAQAVATAVDQLRDGLPTWMAELGYPEGRNEAAKPAFGKALDRIARAAKKLAAKAPELQRASLIPNVKVD